MDIQTIEVLYVNKDIEFCETLRVLRLLSYRLDEFFEKIDTQIIDDKIDCSRFSDEKEKLIFHFANEMLSLILSMLDRG